MEPRTTSSDRTQHCSQCDVTYRVGRGESCACPDSDLAEPKGPQATNGPDNTTGSGSAGSTVVWVADEYRLRLVESDERLLRASVEAESAVQSIKDNEHRFGEDAAKYYAALNAAIKTWGALLEMGRKTRSDLYRTATERESRQEAEINKATAAALKKLRGGGH